MTDSEQGKRIYTIYEDFRPAIHKMDKILFNWDFILTSDASLRFERDYEYKVVQQQKVWYRDIMSEFKKLLTKDFPLLDTLIVELMSWEMAQLYFESYDYD